MPLDVRIVVLYLYLGGFLSLAFSLLLGTGIGRPVGSFRVLIGTIHITSGLAYSVYLFCVSVCTLFCAWGPK